MRPEQIIDYIVSLDLKKYALENKISELFDNYRDDDFIQNDPWSTADMSGGDPFPPEYEDLARLHAIIRKRKLINVLEFGSGKSTLVIGEALRKNYEDYKAHLIGIRRSTPFKLISLESEEKYRQEVIKDCTKKDLCNFVEVVYREAKQTLFNGRLCGQYTSIPSCCPDLIYVDGPMPMSYTNGSDQYMDMRHKEVTNITCDVMVLEPCLLPGTIIIIDGMTNNSRFIRNNLQRNWLSHEDINADFTILVLDEPPLGIHHLRQLEFQSK